MEQAKKRLKVPYIVELDQLSLEEVSQILTERSYLHSMTAITKNEQYAYKPVASFSLARGENDLYVRFFVHGNCLRAVNYTDQSAVEEDSCVGLVLRNPQTHEIVHFAFNCIGTCAAYTQVSTEKQLLESSLLSQIRRFTDLLPRPFCEMEGLFQWQVVVAIPFHLFGIEATDFPDSLWGNFYKRADATALPHYLSWIPVQTAQPDFSHSGHLGELELE